MKKTTLKYQTKRWTNFSKILVLLVLFMSGMPPRATAQSSSVLASANQTAFFQSKKTTFTLKEVLTDIGKHYNVKIAYETRLSRT